MPKPKQSGAYFRFHTVTMRQSNNQITWVYPVTLEAAALLAALTHLYRPKHLVHLSSWGLRSFAA